MTSSEWKNFLSENLGISKSRAQFIYHQILSKVTYYHWFDAFMCRTHNNSFDKSSPKGKCVTCTLKTYCFLKKDVV